MCVRQETTGKKQWIPTFWTTAAVCCWAASSAMAGPIASFQGVGDLPGGIFESYALGTPADGSGVVGYSRSASGYEAFHWTTAGGMVGLGDLPGGSFRSEAMAASADGSVVAGYSRSASGNEAFRWTSGGGMVGLGHLPGGSFLSLAFATSDDGSVVVGYGRSASGYEAFRWTSGGGMVGLGDLPGGSFFSEASATAADGSVVVGNGSSASGTEAFLWTADDGMRSLKDLLATDFGLDLTGWDLTTAKGISSDGRTIVGTGTNPDGFAEAWIATIPEPTTPDCNSNGIGDDCDINCGPMDGPCDVAGCGGSEDCNTDGVPDECEADSDGDGLIDACDNCPDKYNPAQIDLNGNGIGDACELSNPEPVNDPPSLPGPGEPAVVDRP